MTDLYLIAHKVRGEPAFDIAVRMECPECEGKCEGICSEGSPYTCIECDALGYWWIIPTSGHRAYPYWECELNKCEPYPGGIDAALRILPSFWTTLPDHYITTSAPNEPKVSLLDRLNLKPKPSAPTLPFPRRI